MSNVQVKLSTTNELTWFLFSFCFKFRVFSRIATIPFQKITGIQTLRGSLQLKTSLQPVLCNAVLSVGILLELRSEFQHMQEDPLFRDVCQLLEHSQLDMRSQLNYALLLFSTGKVC